MNSVSDIAVVSNNLLVSTYVFFSASANLFFNFNKGYATGNDSITLGSANVCYCFNKMTV